MNDDREIEKTVLRVYQAIVDAATSSDDMTARVAEAIFEAGIDDHQQKLAALEAMREINEDMISAGLKASRGWNRNKLVRVWHAMIDQALIEPPGDLLERLRVVH
jgi:hypothetical protein